MLIVEKLRSGYGDVEVLRDLELSVREGEVMCLLGRNGAGKTTFLKTIMGLLRTRSGNLCFGTGSDTILLNTLNAHEIAGCGIGYVPQGRRLFGELTVAENLEIGKRARPDVPDQQPYVLDLFPALESRLRQRAGTLSGGEQQMLAIARALCLSPSLLLMDEPTEGLQPSMIKVIRDTVHELRQRGVTTIIVEQRVDAVLPVADRVSFIENGRCTSTHPVGALQVDPKLVQRYVGVS